MSPLSLNSTSGCLTQDAAYGQLALALLDGLVLELALMEMMLLDMCGPGCRLGADAGHLLISDRDPESPTVVPPTGPLVGFAFTRDRHGAFLPIRRNIWQRPSDLE